MDNTGLFKDRMRKHDETESRARNTRGQYAKIRLENPVKLARSN